MKRLAFLILLATALLASNAAFAAEGTGDEDQLTFEYVIDGDSVTIDASDMDVGEVRQVYTEAGKQVVLSRNEEGFDLEIDGEHIALEGPGHGVHVLGAHPGATQVFVKRIHKDDGGEDVDHQVFVFSPESEHHVALKIAGDGEAVSKRVREVLGERRDPGQHLIDSGALDGVDEATRQKILDALKDWQGHEVRWISNSAVVIDGDDVGEDDDN